jgi:hypothetical protein
VAEDRPQEPSDEELVAKLEEELRKLTVSDILLQTALTLSSLGFRKLSSDDVDLAQARLAVEGLKVIVPVLESSLPEQTIKDLNQVIAHLQLAYAKAFSESRVAGADADAESASQPA